MVGGVALREVGVLMEIARTAGTVVLDGTNAVVGERRAVMIVSEAVIRRTIVAWRLWFS